MTGGLGVIKISLAIRLQTHGELVEMLGDLVVVVEVLDEVDFAVPIEIAEPRNLVATSYVNRLIHNFYAERLKKSGGESFPDQMAQRVVDARNDPHVPTPRRDRCAMAVGHTATDRRYDLWSQPRQPLSVVLTRTGKHRLPPLDV